MTMSQIITAIGDVVAYLVGGSTSGETTITFANSWVGQITGAITSNPIILIFVIVGLVFLGLNAVRKLMRV